MKDLIVLVPDLDIENVLRGLFSRVSLVCGLREFSFEILRHINRDPGCYNESADFLRPFTSQYAFAMVVFDREGCGQENKERSLLESEVEDSLLANGWNNQKAAVVVIDPEIENWMWLKSPHVATALGWNNVSGLFDWLVSKGLLEPPKIKPRRPKEAMEAALRAARKPRSSSIYKLIAENASWKKCTDPAFLKMMNVLANWFQPNN